MSSGPPVEHAFSLLITRLTKIGEKMIFEMPGPAVHDVMQGNLRLSITVVN